MKKHVLSAVLLALAGLARAEDSVQPKSSYSVTVDFPYVSKYVFRGLELSKDAIQPSVELATGDFYVGVWTSQPITRHQNNEFDFYGGYKLKLNDAWNIDTGATVYCYPERKKSLGERGNTTELHLGLNGDIKGISPGVYAYYDTTLGTTTVQLQAGYSLPLSSAGLSLDFSANAGRVYDPHAPDYYYWSLGMDIPYKLSDKATAYAGLAYANNDYRGQKRDLLSYRVGLTVGF